MDVLYDTVRFTAMTNTLGAHLLQHPIPFLPWVYPPTFLLVLVPFALPSFVAGYVLFMSVSVLVLGLAVRAYATAMADRLLFTVALLLSPAMAVGVMYGQNGLLTSGLLLGGFALRSARPVLAGVLIGLLSFKPQLGLLLPIVLLADGNYRSFASAALVTILFAAVSLAVFGIAPWHEWLQFASGGGELFRQWSTKYQADGAGVFAGILVLTGSFRLALYGQFAAILASALVVYRVFATRTDRDCAFAILTCACMLSAPHLLSYDMLLLAPGAAAMLLFINRHDLGLLPQFACLLLWVSPLLTFAHHLPLSILLVAVCGGYFWHLSRPALPVPA